MFAQSNRRIDTRAVADHGTADGSWLVPRASRRHRAGSSAAIALTSDISWHDGSCLYWFGAFGQAGEGLSKRGAEIDCIWMLNPGYAGHAIPVSRYKRFTLATQLRDTLTHLWLATVNAKPHRPDREVEHLIGLAQGVLDDA